MLVLKYFFRGFREFEGASIVIVKVEVQGAKAEIHCSFQYANHTKEVFLFIINPWQKGKSYWAISKLLTNSRNLLFENAFSESTAQSSCAISTAAGK